MWSFFLRSNFILKFQISDKWCYLHLSAYVECQSKSNDVKNIKTGSLIILTGQRSQVNPASNILKDNHVWSIPLVIFFFQFLFWWFSSHWLFLKEKPYNWSQKQYLARCNYLISARNFFVFTQPQTVLMKRVHVHLCLCISCWSLPSLHRLSFSQPTNSCNHSWPEVGRKSIVNSILQPVGDSF